MICLPAVAELQGTPLLVPRCSATSTNDDNDGGGIIIHELLATLGGGTCIQCDNEQTMEAMMVSTTMMGPLYGFMKANRDYLIKNGVPPQDANLCVSRQYFAMTRDALGRAETDGETSLDALIDEQTPGGLNEQTLKNFEKRGFLETFDEVMDAVLKRIQGKGDGSLSS